MDAASAYVIGHALSQVSIGAPQPEEVDAIFKKGWEARQQWPKTLFLTEQTAAANAFKEAAEQKGITTETVPLSSLKHLIGPLKEEFLAAFSGN